MPRYIIACGKSHIWIRHAGKGKGLFHLHPAIFVFIHFKLLQLAGIVLGEIFIFAFWDTGIQVGAAV